MLKRLLVLALVGIASLSLPYLSAAQEDTEYSYGTVVKVDAAANKIVVSEYNYDSDLEEDVTYDVSPDVKFDNVASLKDVPVGSDIDIEYVIREGGRKIAKFIGIYEADLELE